MSLEQASYYSLRCDGCKELLPIEEPGCIDNDRYPPAEQPV